jgi:speckle-type POZ protein
VRRERPGRFCIRIKWQNSREFKIPIRDTEITSFHYYCTSFEVKGGFYILSITKFVFQPESKEIQCDAQVQRIACNKEDDNESRPIAVSFFVNEEETRHQLLESWGLDRWGFKFLNHSFAYPDGKEFTKITCETTNPNEWNSLTCLLWLEFDIFSGGERNALKQLTELYVQQNQCDVQFNLQDDQHIGGHSHILVARSPVFAAMFQREMMEKKTGQVSIQDIQPDIFKQLLHYIYSGRLPLLLTETTAQRLFEAADKYDIGDLKEECVSFLLLCIRVDNVINLMAWAHIHSVDELKEETLKFTSFHGKEISLLEDWENLTKNYPEVCLEATRSIIECHCLNSAER